MADASKLKGLRRSGLGAPPPLDEARTDLVLAPARELANSHANQPSAANAATPVGSTEPAAARTGRLDGRTMRRSGRTVQFATRVSPDFDERIRQIALRDRMLLVEVLERALDAYEAGYKK